MFTHQQVIDGTLVTLDEATLYVTEGCPFECSFCASPVMVNRGNGVRPYNRPDTSRIGEEVEQTITGLGANAIHFLDDMVFINGQQIAKFHVDIQKRGLLGKFHWRGLTRVNTVLSCNDDVMQKMKETGVWRLALGVESGNEEVLKQINKRTTKDQTRRAIDKLARARIQSESFFIMGFPGETEEQIQETADFIQELKGLGLSEISVFQFKPYPGTREYERLKQTNPDVWLDDDLAIAAVKSGK